MSQHLQLSTEMQSCSLSFRSGGRQSLSEMLRELRLGGCGSVAQSCPTLCCPMNCSTPGFPVLHHLLEFLKLMSIELVMPSNYLILCQLLSLLPLIFPSIKVFSNE